MEAMRWEAPQTQTGAVRPEDSAGAHTGSKDNVKAHAGSDSSTDDLTGSDHSCDPSR